MERELGKYRWNKTGNIMINKEARWLVHGAHNTNLALTCIKKLYDEKCNMIEV